MEELCPECSTRILREYHNFDSFGANLVQQFKIVEFQIQPIFNQSMISPLKIDTNLSYLKKDGSDHSGTSRDLEFTDLINNIGEIKTKDDHKRLCEHYCGKILRGEIGLVH